MFDVVLLSPLAIKAERTRPYLMVFSRAVNFGQSFALRRRWLRKKVQRRFFFSIAVDRKRLTPKMQSCLAFQIIAYTTGSTELMSDVQALPTCNRFKHDEVLPQKIIPCRRENYESRIAADTSNPYGPVFSQQDYWCTCLEWKSKGLWFLRCAGKVINAFV